MSRRKEGVHNSLKAAVLASMNYTQIIKTINLGVFMTGIVLQPTVLAEWQALVKEAENSSRLVLTEDLESYLVFLLMRFINHPEMADSVLALEFLRSIEKSGARQKDELRNVGDKCLLFAGLFPGRAEKRHVEISYFVELGQQAYANLSAISQQKLADLYKELGEEFVRLMDVLQTIRESASNTFCLTPLQAVDLWADTGSHHALSVFRKYSQAHPILGSKSRH